MQPVFDTSGQAGDEIHQRMRNFLRHVARIP